MTRRSDSPGVGPFAAARPLDPDVPGVLRGLRRRLARFGFTLIELLVVIAVIAVLAALIFPVFSRTREKEREALPTESTH